MTNTQWLWLIDGTQLMLFGLGWAGCARMATDARRPMQGLAVFNLLTGLGLALVGLRGQAPYVLTHMVAGVCQVLAYVVLWRAGQALALTRNSTTEQCLLALAGVGLMVWYGGSPETSQQRVAVNFAVIGYVAFRGGWQACVRFRQEGSPGAAALMLLTGWTVAALLAGRAATGWMTHESIEFDRPSTGNLGLAFVLLAAVFALNLVFAYVVFGRLMLKLRQLSRHDALTNLLNRRALMDALTVEWSRFVRDGRPVTVLCLDIDHFKSINDGHGHAAGDTALVGLAEQLRLNMRVGDIVGRSGGEEFLAILPGTVEADARDVAERLRGAVAACAGLHPEAQNRLTLSIGLASARPGDATMDALLARADVALYRAKTMGRNRVVSSDDGVAPIRRIEPRVAAVDA